jgi:NADP-dependent 3-hydroxy acid dehydrogenase YdfG
MSLSSAIALVTGASGDIGRAIAFDFPGAGAEVFMLGRNMVELVHPPPPENAQARCRFVVADLADDCAARRIGG